MTGLLTSDRDSSGDRVVSRDRVSSRDPVSVRLLCTHSRGGGSIVEPPDGNISKPDGISVAGKSEVAGLEIFAGMRTVRHVLRDGGKIRVESTYGEGSTFIVTIPIGMDKKS